MAKLLSGEEKAVQAVVEYYNSLAEHQLAFYHRVPRARIHDWKLGVAGPPTPTESHQNVLHVGALGSGKSVGGFFTTLALSAFIPDNLGIIVRKRWEELKNHVVDELFRLAKEITEGNEDKLLSKPKLVGGSYEITVFTTKEPSRIIIKPEPDGSNRFVEDSFKGPEYGWFLLDELTQLRQPTWDALIGRLRRQFPRMSTERAAQLWAGLALSNPPSVGQWVHDYLTAPFKQLELEDDLTTLDTLVIRSTMEDNKHLPPEYILREKRKYRNDPIRYRMYVLGEDGIDIQGRPVFGDIFRSDLHTTRMLRYNPYQTLYVGLDFGWHHPAAVFLQKDQNGNINILGELLGEELTADQFADDVKDYIAQVFPKAQEVEYFGDIAGAQQTDKGDPTFVILAKKGIHVRARKLNIDPGLNQIRDLLTTMRNGRARLQLNEVNTPILCKGFIGGYHYKTLRSGAASAKPNKDGLYDHLFDALRYVLAGVCGVYREDDTDEDTKLPLFAKGITRKPVSETWKN